MDERYGVAAFRSRQQVLKINEMLKREGIPSAVVSTPREISAGCGLSVRFDLKDAGSVKRVISYAKPVNLIGLYMVTNENGKRSRLSSLSFGH